MRNSPVSVMSWVAGAAVLATLVLSVHSASAAVNYNSSKSNSGNVAAPACPAGEKAGVNPATGKPDCVAAVSKTYNASHSNTASDGPCPTCAKCVNPKGCS